MRPDGLFNKITKWETLKETMQCSFYFIISQKVTPTCMRQFRGTIQFSVQFKRTFWY